MSEKKKKVSLIIFFNFLYLSFYFFYPTIFNENSFLDILISKLEQGDIGYYPLVIEYSKLNFFPTFLDFYESDKFVSFPFFPILIQSFLFKIFGSFSFVMSTFIFNTGLLIILFYFFYKIFKDNLKAFLAIVLILFSVFLFKKLSISFGYFYFDNLFSIFDGNFGIRYPRPLITSPVFFFGLYLLFEFNKKFCLDFNINYALSLILVSGILLHTFFYYFIIFNFLILILFLKNLEKKTFQILKIKKNLIKIFSLIFIFLFLYIFQQVNIEEDNLTRIGVIELEFDKKILLLKYFLLSLLRIDFLPLIGLSIFFYIYSNKRFNQINKYSLNVIFYFIISSLLSIIIFIIFSPKIVSMYHFIGIFIFSIIFYNFINILILLFKYFDFLGFRNFYKIKSIFFIFLITLIFNLYDIRHIHKTNFENYDEIKKINFFLKENKFENTEKTLFTYDQRIMNLWLLKKNKNLIISYGFANSLSNEIIENNLINSLKSFGWNENDFYNFLSVGETIIRDSWSMYLFIYQYQANSLYTYSQIENYLDEFRKTIKNTSPLRAQIQVMPEDEKLRLLKKFKSLNLNSNILPDLIIIQTNINKKNNHIKNTNYKKIFSTKNFEIFEKN